MKDPVKTFYAASRAEWRQWLETHHRSEQSVWLIIYKQASGVATVTYPEAVDEALCFGWIDSKPNKRDDQSYCQFFSKRSPKSNWSRVNKDKVDQLLAQNLIAPAGLESIALAKANGTWTALDEVENLVVPADMQQLLDADPVALGYWNGFPRSVKRGILEWILTAKKPETRQKRIQETVQLAHANVRANQFKR
jgi:uncharacterized protein YdeI (YjbR/CyaY-like superfamily)